MGCAPSKAREIEVSGGIRKAQNDDTPGVGREHSHSERRQRSLVGNLMQSHNGADSLKLEEEYDDSDAKVLGSGMSGQVATIRHRRTGVIHALKTLNVHQMGVEGLDALRKEIDAMRRLDHPNIVKLYEIFEDEESIHMIMELCTGGELVAHIMEMPTGINETDGARHITKMLSALCHCHEHNVVHRDVKLDNFVYENESDAAELKLIDFGLSHLGSGKPGDAIAARGRVGTLSYMAPEVLRRKPYAKPCDMWSLGVVAFILLAGRRPFHSRDREEKIELILSAEPNYGGSGWRGISDEAKQFVQSLLQKEPELRMTAQQALQHHWLQAAREGEISSPATAIKYNIEVMRSLQAFSTTTRLHKVALELLAFAAPSHEVNELRQVFNAIDTDGSGAISREEFKHAMTAHPQFKDSEVRRLFDQIDFSRKGELSYNEFLAATLDAASGPPDEEKVRLVFERLDIDGDGIVTRDDMLRALGAEANEEEIDTMFSQLGCSKGRLFFADLLRLMTDQDDQIASRRSTRAGIKRKSCTRTSVSSTPSNKPPTIGALGKSMTMSDLVLETEASKAKADAVEMLGEEESARPAWLSKGRSIQNLNKFIALATIGGGGGGGGAGGGEPNPPQLAHQISPVMRERGVSKDGTVMQPTIQPRQSSHVPDRL